MIPKRSAFYVDDADKGFQAVDNAYQYQICLQKSIDNAPENAPVKEATVKRNRLLKRAINNVLKDYKKFGISCFMNEVGLDLNPKEVNKENAYEVLQWMHHYYANILWHFKQLPSPTPLRGELFDKRDKVKAVLEEIGGSEGNRLSLSLKPRNPKDAFVGERVRDSSQITGGSFKLYLHDAYDPTKRVFYINRGRKTIGAVRTISRQTKSRRPAMEIYFVSVNPAFNMTETDAKNIYTKLKEHAKSWGFKELLLPDYISDHHSVQSYFDRIKKGKGEKLPFKPIGNWERMSGELKLPSPVHPTKRSGEPTSYHRVKL